MKPFYETIIAEGGFAGQVFDITQGDSGSFPDNLDVINVLLGTGNGTLTGNTPINLISTGTLNAPRSLNISATEQNGRVFFLSIRNTDIITNSLTIVATTDINGGGASFVIKTIKDYLFVHESGGVWRAYESLGPDAVITLELESSKPSTHPTYFKDLTYTGSSLTKIEVWDSPSLLLKLFTKDLTYTGNKLTMSVTTRHVDGITLVKTFTYTGSNLTSIDRFIV